MTSKFNIDNRELLQRINCGEAVVGIDFGNLIVRELAAFRLAAMDQKPAVHRYRRKAVEPYGTYPWYYEEFVDLSRPLEGIEDEYYYAAPPAVSGFAVDSEPAENHIGSKNALDAIVSFIKSKSNPTVKCYEDVSEQLFKDNCHGIHSHVIEYILKLGEELEDLRAAQPAPVAQCIPLGDSPYDVPHSMPSNLRELIAEEIGILFSDDDAQSVWDVFRRAAMLQAGNSPAQSDCCPAQNHVSPEQSGDTPAQSQGWIPVSEQMPPSRHEVLVGRWWGEKPRWCCKWATYIPGHPDAQSSGWLIPGGSWTPTHWMELPAGPKEVK